MAYTYGSNIRNTLSSTELGELSRALEAIGYQARGNRVNAPELRSLVRERRLTGEAARIVGSLTGGGTGRGMTVASPGEPTVTSTTPIGQGSTPQQKLLEIDRARRDALAAKVAAGGVPGPPFEPGPHGPPGGSVPIPTPEGGPAHDPGAHGLPWPSSFGDALPGLHNQLPYIPMTGRQQPYVGWNPVMSGDPGASSQLQFHAPPNPFPGSLMTGLDLFPDIQGNFGPAVFGPGLFHNPIPPEIFENIPRPEELPERGDESGGREGLLPRGAGGGRQVLDTILRMLPPPMPMPPISPGPPPGAVPPGGGGAPPWLLPGGRQPVDY